MTFILLRIHLLGWNRRKRVTAIECGDGVRREKLLKLLHTIKTYHKRNNRIKTNNNNNGNGENERKEKNNKVCHKKESAPHTHSYMYIFIQSKSKRRVWWWFVQHSLQKYQLPIERSLNIKFSVDCKIYCFIFMIVREVWERDRKHFNLSRFLRMWFIDNSLPLILILLQKKPE